MAKRKTLKEETAAKPAKITREWKRAKLDAVMRKGKVETIGDTCAVFYGLSRKAVEMAALGKIQQLAALGLSPAEIVKRMEPEKQKENL